jgi:hypothetical protein
VVDLVAVNVLVLGLDAHNERILRNMPDGEQYRFDPLLSVEDICGERIPLLGLLDKAARQRQDYMGRKIASEDAARVLEIIGRSHQAEVTVHVDDGPEG